MSPPIGPPSVLDSIREFRVLTSNCDADDLQRRPGGVVTAKSGANQFGITAANILTGPHAFHMAVGAGIMAVIPFPAWKGVCILTRTWIGLGGR